MKKDLGEAKSYVKKYHRKTFPDTELTISHISDKVWNCEITSGIILCERILIEKNE